MEHDDPNKSVPEGTIYDATGKRTIDPSESYEAAKKDFWKTLRNQHPRTAATGKYAVEIGKKKKRAPYIVGFILFVLAIFAGSVSTHFSRWPLVAREFRKISTFTSQIGIAPRATVPRSSFSILVARIEGDVGDKVQTLLANSFHDRPAISVVRLDRISSVIDSRQPNEEQAKANESASSLLHAESADILIWGYVLPVAEPTVEVGPKNWTGRIDNPTIENRSPCPKNDGSIIPSSKPK
jgi:hypothetical protein